MSYFNLFAKLTVLITFFKYYFKIFKLNSWYYIISKYVIIFCNMEYLLYLCRKENNENIY